MKKLTKILLISASMILASCGSPEKPAESAAASSAASTPTSSKVESGTSEAPKSSAEASKSTAATSSETTPVLGGWQNDGTKVNEAQPVKNVSANQTGYELTATDKEVANAADGGKWDNGKLKGNLEWNVLGMSDGKYDIYMKAEYSTGNGSSDFFNKGDVPTGQSRYMFQADAEEKVAITATETYSELGFPETGAGAEWSNKALCEIEIKEGTAKISIIYNATGYSIYLAALRLVRTGDLPAAPVAGQGTVTLADGASALSEGADGITVDNATNTIHFTKEGVYGVTGTLTNGSLVVDEEVGEGTVELDLTGTCSIGRSGADTSAPIVGNHAGKLKVKKDGKTSVITINDTRTISKNAANPAAIYAKGYLDVPGGGTMTVTTNGTGLQSDTRIETKKGTLNITAGKKGIYARRSVMLGEEGGNFNITSTSSHGVEVESVEGATFTEEELQGVCLVDGNFNIKGNKKGINSSYLVDIQGGKGTIESTNGDRAINAKAELKMSGGTLSYKATADNAIKADLGATISGGKHTLESDVKAFVTLKDLTVTGGELTVTKATDGIEAANVSIDGESTVVSVKASANGINAIGEAGSDISPIIEIKGGKTYVESTGDGIDSNGEISVTGGTTVINQSGTGNAAIDYATTFQQNGGLLVAYGENEGAPENTGTQRSIIASSEGCTTGNFFKVANGETTYYVKPQSATAYQLYISAPEFTNGAVTVSQIASATEGMLVFKGIYTTVTEEGEATVLGTGTFSDTALHLNTIPVEEAAA